MIVIMTVWTPYTYELYFTVHLILLIAFAYAHSVLHLCLAAAMPDVHTGAPLELSQQAITSLKLNAHTGPPRLKGLSFAGCSVLACVCSLVVSVEGRYVWLHLHNFVSNLLSKQYWDMGCHSWVICILLNTINATLPD